MNGFCALQARKRHESARRALAGVLALAPASACGGAEAQREREVAEVRQESSADALFKKGQAAAALGDLTRAEQYYASAMKAGGDERAVIHHLLRVCIADQRFPVALEYAEQYLYRHPRDVDVKFAAASIHAALGENERARQLLGEVLRSRPESPEVHYALATVLREQGDAPVLADRHDLEYLRLDPKGPHAEQARARLTGGAP